jgi:CubicO group peptidase (beta-lactamase class C family)
VATATYLTQGSVSHEFQRLRQHFDFLMTLEGERGGALAVVREGDVVADLVSSEATESRTPLRTIFSGTKALTATVMARVLDEASIDPGRRVADLWPAFAAAGKRDLTVGSCLSHTAGLPALVREVPLDALPDADAMADEVARQPVYRDMQGRLVYHALTYGWLCHGITRAVTGSSVGQLFRELVAEPLSLNAWIGLPAAKDAAFVASTAHTTYRDARNFPTEASRLIIGRPPLFETFDHWNSVAWRRGEIAAANAIADARSAAVLMSALACGGRLNGGRVVSEDALGRSTRTYAQGIEPCTNSEMRFGLGFATGGESAPFDRVSGAFGHGGHGGILLFAWPRARLGFAFIPGALRNDPADYRARLLTDVVTSCAREAYDVACG